MDAWGDADGTLGMMDAWGDADGTHGMMDAWGDADGTHGMCGISPGTMYRYRPSIAASLFTSHLRYSFIYRQYRCGLGDGVHDALAVLRGALERFERDANKMAVEVLHR